MSTAPSETPLHVADLTAEAEGAVRPLLDRVALTVRTGTVLGVVGPSGSGKTTLGLAVLGAARPGVTLTGRSLLDGTDLLALDPARRPPARAGRAAHLPQHPETVLDPVRRIGGALTELAALGHSGRHRRRAAAHRALALAGLEPEQVHRRFPHQLSGGQQQRLALASALVTGARLLVLDEPTSGLDPALALALSRTVRALADDGVGVLLLSHDLPLVRATADRTLVLDRGQVVDEGTAHQVLGAEPSGPGCADDARDRSSVTRQLLYAEGGLEASVRPGRTGGRRPAPGSADTARTVAADGVVVRRRFGHPLPGPVSMAFPPGSRISLLGPSGSGKTTFARVLAGLTAPTLGTVRCGDRRLPARIDRRSAEQRRIVQYVHQASAESFERRRPVLDQLVDTARLLRGATAEDAAGEALRAAWLLGLEETQLRRTPGRLSGGQLQRCALIRATAARPALLICDEVTSALDTVSRDRVLAELPGLLAPADTALLFISHDLPAVRALTTEAARFDHGRPVRQGPVDEVLPADSFARPFC